MLKTASESYTEQVHIVNQSDINGNNRLFGGMLMQWIDIVAATVARRHSNTNVTTALVDTLEFREAAHVNDLIVLTGKIIYTGRTSMEISVKSYVEALDGERKLINCAYLVLVAVDENDKATEVPTLYIETEEEKTEWDKAKLRAEKRKKNRIISKQSEQ